MLQQVVALWLWDCAVGLGTAVQCMVQAVQWYGSSGVAGQGGCKELQ